MIVSHEEIKQAVVELYRAGGLPKGSSTGWPSVDKFYSIALGHWTLVTGYPNSGKSEWLDALIVNLARREKWKFCIYSPENWPLAIHHANILEKYTGRPFNPGPTERMSEAELNAGEEWIKGKFHFCKMDRPDIVSIIDEAASFRSLADGWKVGVIVDPWNMLEHYRPPGLSETEYVSQTLSTVIERVRNYNLHLWLVAHPKKLDRNKDGTFPVPTPRDVSTSAHFWNKCDCCVTIHRDQVEQTQQVEIHVQKIRFKHIGRIGLAMLDYDRVTGRYHEQLKTAASDYKRASGGDD